MCRMLVATGAIDIYSRLKKVKMSEAAAKEIAALFDEANKNSAASQHDILKLEVKLAEIEARLVEKIETSKAATIQWVAGMLVAQAGVFAALMKIFSK